MMPENCAGSVAKLDVLANKIARSSNAYSLFIRISLLLVVNYSSMAWIKGFKLPMGTFLKDFPA
jgi:hypothetical protein